MHWSYLLIAVLVIAILYHFYYAEEFVECGCDEWNKTADDSLTINPFTYPYSADICTEPRKCRHQSVPDHVPLS